MPFDAREDVSQAELARLGFNMTDYVLEPLPEARKLIGEVAWTIRLVPSTEFDARMGMF